jgi:hypothetical protein
VFAALVGSMAVVQVSGPVWLWLAGSSLALTSGFAWVFAFNGYRGRAVFLAIALLLLTAWPMTRNTDLLTAPSPWLLVLWTLAWPACMWQLARVLGMSLRAAPVAPTTPASSLARWQALNRRLNRRGFVGSRADPRWLMHHCWPDITLNGLLSLAATCLLLAWLWRDLSLVLLWSSFMLLLASAREAMTVLHTGVRPRLLLLPGGHSRNTLAWTLFCAMLRQTSAIVCCAALVGTLGAALGGVDMALRCASVGLCLAGSLVLAFGGSLALRAWVPHRGWRAAIQLLAGIGWAVAGGWIVSGTIAATRPAEWPMLAGALALALLQALTGAALARASSRAWARLDLAAVSQPQRPFWLLDPWAQPAR